MQTFFSLCLKHFFRRVPAAVRAVAAIGLLSCSIGHAQTLQRAMINPGFESDLKPTASTPWTGTTPGTGQFDHTYVLGWETTHINTPASCVGPASPFALDGTCRPIEFWFNGPSPSGAGGPVASAAGKVHVELNAQAASMIYQNICVNAGESFNFGFAHRARTTGFESASFILAMPATNPTVTYTIAIVQSSRTSGSFLAGGLATSRVYAAVTAENGTATWSQFTGNYAHTTIGAVSGIGRLGFIANGGSTLGNFLDDVQISLKPYVEFDEISTTSSVEGGTLTLANAPTIRMEGNTTGASRFTLTFSSPVARYGVDYDFSATDGVAFNTIVSAAVGATTGMVSFSVPAGNYATESGNARIKIPLRVIDNSTIENNRTISFVMSPSSGSDNWLLANAVNCGESARTTLTHIIIDNDVLVRTNKAVTPTSSLANPVAVGTTVTYTVTIGNMTPAGALSQAPLTAHDVTGLQLTDLVPTNMSFPAWTCAALGGAICSAASGSGDISGAVALPVGSTLTYVVTGVVSTSTAIPSGPCGTTITNTATAAFGVATLQPANGSYSFAALSQGTSVASYVAGSASFSTQPLQATTTTSIGCAALSVSKTNGVSTVLAGSTTTYTIVVSNAGPSHANGALLRDVPSAGLSCTGASCTASAGGAACPAGFTATPTSPAAVTLTTAPGVTLTTLPANSSLTFQLSCSVSASGL